MIRRFYIMPLNAGLTKTQVDELVGGMNAADKFLDGISDSWTGLDEDSATAIWENNLIDEAMYSGPYMHHPYHAGTLDEYLMGDSPRCWTHDTFTVRYVMEENQPRPEKGIRRLMLLKIPEDSGTAELEALAASPAHMAASVFQADTVGWVSPKGRAWTHVWEQSFADRDALDSYLQTREGKASASMEGLKRLRVKLDALKIFTYAFDVTKPQGAKPISDDPFPTFYAITARLKIEDADTFIDLLRTCYDPVVSDAGGKLSERFRTVEAGYPWVEVQSIWELKSVAAFHDLRMKTGSDPRWTRFVTDGMSLVLDGSRRFYHAS